jgi:asparagine synthase (glutamine-hydrolysing)
MVIPDHQLVGVYNGETYNFEELRAELRAAGDSFSTNGDTEVALRWIGRKWIHALPKFDAMFAIAVWDKRRECLLLARDSIGEKPLFYACPQPGMFVFGSEPKAILEHPSIVVQCNEDGLRQVLQFRAVYTAESLWGGIQQLEPGTALEFSRDGLKVTRFYDPFESYRRKRLDLQGFDEQQLIRDGRSLFVDSVKRRLVADVPVGAFLSGGLDSSLIVAAMRESRAKNEEIRTFSVGFVGDRHSELEYAEAVATKFRTTHQAISVGPEVYVRRLSELTLCRDAPVSQPADIAIAEMSHLARQSVKVALSGEGADEIFAGYPKHRFAAPPIALRGALSLISPDLASHIAGILGMDRHRALIALRAMAAPNEIGRLTQWFSFFGRQQLKRLFPGLGWSQNDFVRASASQAAALANVKGESPLLRMQAVDLVTWLPGNMLERGDRMTMAEGLEVRPPFLDRELVAFGLALPDRLKLRGRVGKWIVRQWAHHTLPPQITARPKWGFRVPLNEWFRGPLREMLNDYLTRSNGLVGKYGDRKAILNLLSAHESGASQAGEALWTLLTTEIWYCDVFLARRHRKLGI